MTSSSPETDEIGIPYSVVEAINKLARAHGMGLGVAHMIMGRAFKAGAATALAALGEPVTEYGVRYGTPHPHPDRIYPIATLRLAQMLVDDGVTDVSVTAMQSEIWRSGWVPVTDKEQQ